MGIKGQRFEEELDPDSVGKGDLCFIHVVSRWQLAAGQLVRDVTSPWFGEPSYYQRSNTMTAPPIGGVAPLQLSSLGYKPGEMLFIHPSRVIRLLGAEYSDMETAPDAWGDSILQVVNDAIRDAAMTSSAVAHMMSEGKLDIFKVPGLANAMSTTEGSSKMQTRFMNANAAKSVVNAILLDATEEFVTRQLRLEGTDKVMAMFLMIACGAADIPATRLLGREPAGQNATGESDVRNYYDRLSSDQEVRLTPVLTPLDEVVIRHTFGSRDPNIHYNWASLWQESDDVKSQTGLRKAQAFQIDVNSGVLDPIVLKKSRESQLIEDGTYPGMENALDEAEAAGRDQDELPEPRSTMPPEELDLAQKALAQKGALRFIVK